MKEYENLLPPFFDRTVMHVQKMYEAFGEDAVFGRSGVQSVTGIKHARASELLQILSEGGSDEQNLCV